MNRSMCKRVAVLGFWLAIGAASYLAGARHLFAEPVPPNCLGAKCLCKQVNAWEIQGTANSSRGYRYESPAGSGHWVYTDSAVVLPFDPQTETATLIPIYSTACTAPNHNAIVGDLPRVVTKLYSYTGLSPACTIQVPQNGDYVEDAFTDANFTSLEQFNIRWLCAN